MFLGVVAIGARVAIAWIEKDKPEPVEEPPVLVSLDGYVLCPGCRHPKVASHITRTVITEETFRQ